MNKRLQQDFKETPLVAESLKMLKLNKGAVFLLGEPIKASCKISGSIADRGIFILWKC
jgi:hypothetical protein